MRLCLPMVAMISLALLAGCAPSRPPDARRLEPPVEEDISFVFGYLDMKLAPTRLGWLEMKQISPPDASRYYQMRIHQGLFYMEKFPPGVFELSEFGGKDFLGRQRAYRLPRQSPALRLTIPGRGAYFLGAWQFRPARDPSAPEGRFTLGRTEKPTEGELLGRLLPFARNTAWKERLQRRIVSLKKGELERD